MPEYIVPFRFSFTGDAVHYGYTSVLQLDSFASYEAKLESLELSAVRLKGGPDYQAVNMMTAFNFSISSIGPLYPEIEQTIYKMGTGSSGTNEILTAYNTQIVYPYDSVVINKVGLTVRPGTSIILQSIAYSNNIVPSDEKIYLYGRLYFDLLNPFNRK